MTYSPEQWQRECARSQIRSLERRYPVSPHPWPQRGQWIRATLGALLAILIIYGFFFVAFGWTPA